MNIKNHTSSVSADKSILQIERILIELGATNIAKEYKNGKVRALSFAIPINGNINQPFQLPIKTEALTKHFLKEYKRVTEAQRKNCEEQAERTAWKNVKEWVEIQATMIKLEQVEFMEVFLPYAFSMGSGQTLFESIKGGDFKLLQ